MARSRSYPTLLEQSRRHWRKLLVGGGAVLLAVGGGLLVRPGSEQQTGAAAAVAPPSGRVTVEVLNGTQRQGAARTATRVLRSRRLDVVFLGNADSLVDSTLVVARRGDAGRARYVAAALGQGVVVVETDTFRRVDVSVILGADFKPRVETHP